MKSNARGDAAMIPVRFTLQVKTPNPSNGMGASSRMAASGLRKKQRQVAHEGAISMLRAIGLPTRMVWVKPRMAKGVVVRPGFQLEVVDLPHARWVVDVVRLSAGRLDDHDNLRSALKGIVDGLADANPPIA